MLIVDRPLRFNSRIDSMKAKAEYSPESCCDERDEKGYECNEKIGILSLQCESGPLESARETNLSRHRHRRDSEWMSLAQ